MDEDSPPQGCFGGCLPLLSIAVIASALLFVNAGIVFAFLETTGTNAPRWLRSSEMEQFLVFVLPVVLLFVQWTLFDFFRAQIWHRIFPPHQESGPVRK